METHLISWYFALSQFPAYPLSLSAQLFRPLGLSRVPQNPRRFDRAVLEKIQFDCTRRTILDVVLLLGFTSLPK